MVANVVYEAIVAGVRHLDCACDYGNEVEVGHGIKRAIDAGIVTRADLWVNFENISKLLLLGYLQTLEYLSCQRTCQTSLSKIFK